MRHLLAATCLTPVALCAFALPLHAETVIGDARTVPILTSTANDDIRISAQGSVKPAGGTAVTIDSNDSVNNQGTIQTIGANDSTGILANAGTAGTITNSGKIILDENFTATDTDTDGDLDGAFAQGARRYGIRVGAGGTFTGNIVNSGEITIEGNDSAGIRLDSNLAGALTSSGKIDVIGNDSQGIRAGNVSGNVGLNGTIQVRGANSVGVALDGDIGGALTVQGTDPHERLSLDHRAGRRLEARRRRSAPGRAGAARFGRRRRRHPVRRAAREQQHHRRRRGR